MPLSKSKIKGSLWYSHFSTLHTENSKEKSKNILSNPISENYNNDINKPFTKKEFEIVIKNLKCVKAEGMDSISNEMIKNSPKEILVLLHTFLNLCLDKSLIPKSWCKDIISPIHKDGDKNDPNKYRGICISSVLLKILCTLLNNRIQEHCLQFSVINKNQIGFRKNHRTVDHLLTLRAVVKKYVTIGKKKLFACFVDFKKAFDSVWHDGLFYKIKKTGIGGNILELIFNIYMNTKCAVKQNNAITDFFDYTKGVRQGCPLSPNLFNIYVNDIFNIMNENNKSDIFLDKDNKINALMYADDLILLSRATNSN